MKNKLGYKREDLAEAFADMLESNEEVMGEMAAFAITCEMFGIDEDDGYSLLAELAEDSNG